MSMVCGEVWTGSDRVLCTELWDRLGMLLLPPGLANHKFCLPCFSNAGLLDAALCVAPSRPLGPSNPSRELGRLRDGIGNCRGFLLVMAAPTDPAVGSEFDCPNPRLPKKRSALVPLAPTFLCCRYPATSRRVFRGKDLYSFWTCCFHDNSLFFWVSVKAS